MTHHIPQLIELIESSDLEGDALGAEVQEILDEYATTVIRQLVEKIQTQNTYNMSLQLEGTVKQITEETTGQGKNGDWKKRGFMLEYADGNYTKLAYIEGMNDKAGAIGQMTVGQKIRAHFNVESREYNGRFYTNLSMWKFETIGNTTPTPQATSGMVGPEGIDPLPF